MLKAAQEDWENSEARQGGGLPDGEYEGVIENAVVGMSKGDKPRTQCVWTLKVTGKNCHSRRCLKFSGMTTLDNLAWFKGDLEAIEVEAPDDLTKIGKTLEQEAIGLPIRFRVRSRDEFTNVDFIERLEGDEEPVRQSRLNEPDDSDDGEPDVTEEDIDAAVKAEDDGELRDLAERLGIDCDPDEYATYPEVGEVLKEAIE
jgi:hypothetical protein